KSRRERMPREKLRKVMSEIKSQGHATLESYAELAASCDDEIHLNHANQFLEYALKTSSWRLAGFKEAAFYATLTTEQKQVSRSDDGLTLRYKDMTRRQQLSYARFLTERHSYLRPNPDPAPILLQHPSLMNH